MGGTCNTHGKDKKCIPANLKGIDHLEDVGVEGRLILEWTLGK